MENNKKKILCKQNEATQKKYGEKSVNESGCFVAVNIIQQQFTAHFRLKIDNSICNKLLKTFFMCQMHGN